MTTIDILKKTKAAWKHINNASGETKNALLLAMADSLERNRAVILVENRADMEAARGHISDVMLDRLYLDEKRLAAMAEGVRAIAALPDHTGRILSEVHRPNGMTIYKKQVPLGLVAIIYESRPNVTSDAAALTLKSGNVCMLRCGKEAYRSAHAIVKALKEGITAAGGDADIINITEDISHQSAADIMTAKGLVDLLIPRGGAGLIRTCVENATVPCIETGTGICHVYVDASADLDMALRHRGERQDQPSLGVQRRGGAAGTQRRGGEIPAHAENCCGGRPGGAGTGPRGAAAGRAGSGHHPRYACRESGTLTRSFWTTFWRSRWWTAWTRPSPTYWRTPPATANASSRRIRSARSGSSTRRTARRCM